jgi:hypothetical protein
MNSFAMIFGHCLRTPPSAKAALTALSLFFGYGVGGEPNTAGGEVTIASEYVSTGKTQSKRKKRLPRLMSVSQPTMCLSKIPTKPKPAIGH